GMEGVTIGNPMPSGDFLCNGDDARPTQCGDANLGRMLRQRDAPNARAGSQVQHRHERVSLRWVECLSERLRAVDRKNILDEPLEESDAILLSIDAMRRSSGPHNLVELPPRRKHCFACQQKKRTMKTGFSANQQRCALLGQRVASCLVLCKHIQPDESIHTIRRPRGDVPVSTHRASIVLAPLSSALNTPCRIAASIISGGAKPKVNAISRSGKT